MSLGTLRLKPSLQHQQSLGCPKISGSCSFWVVFCHWPFPPCFPLISTSALLRQNGGTVEFMAGFFTWRGTCASSARNFFYSASFGRSVPPSSPQAKNLYSTLFSPHLHLGSVEAEWRDSGVYGGFLHLEGNMCKFRQELFLLSFFWQVSPPFQPPSKELVTHCLSSLSASGPVSTPVRPCQNSFVTSLLTLCIPPNPESPGIEKIHSRSNA